MMIDNPESEDDAVHASNYQSMVLCKVKAIYPNNCSYLHQFDTFLQSWSFCHHCCHVVVAVWIWVVLFLPSSSFLPSSLSTLIVNKSLLDRQHCCFSSLSALQGEHRCLLIYRVYVGVFDWLAMYGWLLVIYPTPSDLAVIDPMEPHIPSWYQRKAWYGSIMVLHGTKSPGIELE